MHRVYCRAVDLVITALKKLKKLYVVYAQRRTALKKNTRLKCSVYASTRDGNETEKHVQVCIS